MKKIVSLILVLLLTTAMFAGCKKDDAASGSGSGEPIKIGMLTPLSGDLAQYGQAVLNAAQLAIKQVNDKGGVNGSKIELVYYDNEADQTKSLNLFNRLVDQDKIVALIGPVISGTSLVVAPEANSKKIPMITPTGTNTDITVGYDYVFRACYIDPYQGKMVAKFATEKLAAKTAVVFRNVSSDYSTGLADAFIAGFGGEVVADEGYTQEDSDFNAIITKIKDLNPDVIFIPDYFNKVGLVAKQLKDAGVTATLLGGDGWDGIQIDYADVATGGYFANHYATDDTAAVVQDFIKAYETEYKETPNALGALSFDATNVMLAAIEKAKSTDADAIVEALKATDTDAVCGHITFDENGDPIKDISIITVKDGNLTLETKISDN